MRNNLPEITIVAFAIALLLSGIYIYGQYAVEKTERDTREACATLGRKDPLSLMPPSFIQTITENGTLDEWRDYDWEKSCLMERGLL